MLPAGSGHNPSLPSNPGLVHDPDMLQAAQLLLPSGYNAPCTYERGSFLFYCCTDLDFIQHNRFLIYQMI